MRDCDVIAVELDTSRAIAQPPRRLTTQRYQYIASLAWTRDGSAVIHDALGVGQTPGFWRVMIDSDHAPERIEVGGSDPVYAPAVARSRDRLAFTRQSLDDDIYRFEAGNRFQLVTGSTFSDTDPQLSPDGRRLAFGSARAAAGGTTHDIWTAEADGSNPQRLTRGPGVDQGSPYWSPDGRRIVFDSRGEDFHTHLWMIDADGGAPRRLTAEAGDQISPTWSHDGRWIYYLLRADTNGIWRVSPDGGPPKRITHGAAGPFACESADGSSLLFQSEDADSPLMTMPLPSGAPRQLVACVKNSAFGVGARGVYYVPCDPSPDPPVYLLDLKTGRNARLGTLDGLFSRPLGLSVSPDGNAIVFPT